MLDTLLQLYEIKRLPRTGWVANKIYDPETVAAHSFGAAFLALQLCPENVDRARAVELALVHDVQESMVGDITPLDGVSERDKHDMETKAVDAIATALNCASTRERFAEFEAGSTVEARFARVVDKLDMWLTALLYERNGAVLDYFFAGMQETEFSTVNAVIQEIRAEREAAKGEAY